MSEFGAATRAWFDGAFEAPTEVQARGWPVIAAGKHALLCAPTGSGKTLAAFLSCIDRLSREPPADGTRVVYVSPLKALVYDIDRNLRAPLAGIARAAARAGATIALPRVAVRTGDTTAKERRHQLREPGDILVTTPESLYLLLGSAARENLRSVDTVIVDEVHALAPTKRGAHLALSLERLAALTGGDPQRIGLSATANPLETVAGFLGGDRPVEIVDASRPPDLDLRVIAAAADMTRPAETAFVKLEDLAGRDGESPARSNNNDQPELDPDPDEPPGDQTADTGMWAAIMPALVREITAHRQTIVFVNSRALAERLTHRINEIAGAEIARAHHGSLAHAERRNIEEQLKSGALPAIVATSSLELGIDMGAVDLVLLVEAPKSTASGLQRIGRAGHAVGETSVGRLYPKHRGDLLEAAAVAEQMAAGRIEAIAVPRNPLDVLAQHAVAAVAVEPREVGELGRLVRRAANFRELPESAYLGVLDMLAGRYPSTQFSDLRARIDWDRATDQLTPRRGSKMLAILGGGTIPDRGLYRVVLGDGGPRLGELDEEMVNETTPGQTITLGASTWRVTEITRDKVVVVPAPGEIGTLPFWRGEGPGRPLELGRALGALVRDLEGVDDDERAAAMLAERCHLDEAASRNLLDFLGEQAEGSALPTDRRIVVERFRDELGDYRVCILSPFGSRVHAPWALALEARLSAQTGLAIQSLWADDGIVLRFLDGDAMPTADDLFLDPDDVERLIVDQLAASALFASQFRENAARSLLLPRRRPGERTPLWLQRLKAQQLLSIARDFPAFPIIMETYRACLQDVFDTGALVAILRGVRDRSIEVAEVETAGPSPMARSLVFAYVAAYLYEGDAPLAERRAQALALDRDLLRELLGGDKLRDLLEPEVIAAIEASLLRRGRLETAGGLLDLLRRAGDLSLDELRAAGAPGDDGADVDALVNDLLEARQATAVRLGDGAVHHIAMEDVGLYRDALGCVPPPAAPTAFLEPVDHPLDALLIRFARSRGPLTAAEVADRYGLPERQTAALLSRLAAAGELVKGGFRRGRSGVEFCHPEVLRRIKRDTLAVLRGQVAPAPAVALGRFLPDWHGVGRGRGPGRLEAAVAQLEGLPLSFAELESMILPSRVADYAPAMLDELGAVGAVVWVGRGASGPRDGRIALVRRAHAAALIEPPDLESAELSDIHRAILGVLEQRGASFFVAFKDACSALTAETDEVIEALWELVWLGAITNDTFGPLRARGRRRANTARGKARRIGQVAGGRWSLVSDLCAGAPDPTRAAHRRAVTLLERHGLVCRESVAIEEIAGGFSALYPVLREMEEAGRVRRGYFVDGLGGAQFTLPGAVDRLRAVASKSSADVVVLAAGDPANPYGWLVPWPETAGDGAPRRAAGAFVILRGGEPVFFVDRGGKRMVSFAAARDAEVATDAVAGLAIVARHQRGKALRVATIDGERARAAALADILLVSGFYAESNGLVLEARGSSI